VLEEAIRKKIEDLVSRSEALVPVGGTLRDTHHAASCRGWITEALNIVERAVPIENNAYRRQVTKIAAAGLLLDKVASIGSMLRALLSDANADLIADFGNKIRAETFDDFLDHADEYRQQNEKQAAGVLAGVVFENTIRRICRDKNVPDKDKDLEQLINALARKTVITGQQSKQAKVAAHVRTKATHALWDEYNLDGVADTIPLTRTLLREHLGG
jgi:hypothetical protein